VSSSGDCQQQEMTLDVLISELIAGGSFVWHLIVIMYEFKWYNTSNKTVLWPWYYRFDSHNTFAIVVWFSAYLLVIMTSQVFLIGHVTVSW